MVVLVVVVLVVVTERDGSSFVGVGGHKYMYVEEKKLSGDGFGLHRGQ